MDADQAISLLRTRNEHEVTLPSGLPATVRLPNQQDCILAGGIPFPVLERMSQITNGNEKSKGNGKAEMSTEDIAHIRRFRREIARQTLVGLNGERIEEVTLDVISALAPEDFDELVAIGNREKPLPTQASALTS